jgi:MinD-like ATPase involved in chromosome partitioning or flagellar assembly
MTVEALDAADEVLVVGAADPVGLSRLARALVELRERWGTRPARVVVNRMRSSLGWSERDIVAMVSGFARPSAVHFLPDDQPAVDRALVSGRTLVESGDSEIVRAVARIADTLLPVEQAAPQAALR